MKSAYVVEGYAQGQWDARHVGEVLYWATEAAAERLIDELVQLEGFESDRNNLRIVETELPEGEDYA